MPQQRVLFCDSSQLSAYHVRSGEVRHEASFAPDAAGLAAFADYLAARRRSLFMLLTDMGDESFQVEDIPWSRGPDRQAIIQRKLTQHFYGTPYALAHSQGRLKSGRRDERLLLMALTHPQSLEPWLDTLRRQQAILAGLYALPQLVEALVPAKSTGQAMLLTLTHAGLRQSFVDGGRLRFSRLTPLLHDSAETLALTAASEAAKLYQYLASQRLIERDSPLTTRLYAHPADARVLAHHCVSNASLRFEIVDLAAEARRLGLRSPLSDSRADALFCHLLVRRTPAEQFAPDETLRQHRFWQIRFALQAGAGLAAVSTLLLLAHQGLEILTLRQEAAAAREQSRLNQQLYAQKMASLPQLPISTDALRVLIARYDEVARRAVGPAPLLHQISHSLDAFPTITLERIEWAMREPGASAGGERSPPPPHAGPYAEATLSGRLPLAMVGHQRGQLTLVQDFVKHLAAQPATQASVVQPPIDTQSGKTLKSSDERNTPEAPRFVVRVMRFL